MHPHIAKEPEFVNMFLDEARLAARIRHPNVVGTLDIQRSKAGMYLVMEYVQGPSLNSILRQLRRLNAGPVPPKIALRIFIDVLSGLHAAHELRGPGKRPLHLVHRDLSPHNILVGVDGITRITDFGLARAEQRISSTRGRQIKGKIPYMSPEQITSSAYDRRSDVYSAGVCLWETLVGKRLFVAENDIAMLKLISEGEVAPPSKWLPGLTPLLDTVCLTALHVDAARRYPTARDFGAALEYAAEQGGLSIATARAVTSYVERFSTPLSSRPPPPLDSVPLQVQVPAQAPPLVDEVDTSVEGGTVTQASGEILPRGMPLPRSRGVIGAVMASVLITSGVVTGGAMLFSGNDETNDAPIRSNAATPTGSPVARIPSVASPDPSGTATVAATAARSASAAPSAQASASAKSKSPSTTRPPPPRYRAKKRREIQQPPTSSTGYRPPGL